MVDKAVNVIVSDVPDACTDMNKIQPLLQTRWVPLTMLLIRYCRILFLKGIHLNWAAAFMHGRWQGRDFYCFITVLAMLCWWLFDFWGKTVTSGKCRKTIFMETVLVAVVEFYATNISEDPSHCYATKLWWVHPIIFASLVDLLSADVILDGTNCLD